MYVCILTQQYDFEVKTGVSSTGLRACVYAVSVDAGVVYIEAPTPDTEHNASVWTLAARRPITDGTCM